MLVADITYSEISALLTMIFTFLTTIFAMWIKYKQSQIEQKQDKNAADVKKTVIATTVDQNQRLQVIDSKIDTVNNLVNGGVTDKLKKIAELKQHIFGLTRNPTDEEKAKIAEQDYQDNLARQPKSNHQ